MPIFIKIKVKISPTRLPTRQNFPVCIVPVVILLLSLAVLTFKRNKTWKDEYTLLKNDIKFLDQAYDLYNNFGQILFSSGMRQEGCVFFNKAVLISPKWPVAWNNLGVCHEMQGEYNSAEKCYINAINNSDYAIAYSNYIIFLSKNKRQKEAQQIKQKAGKLFPELKKKFDE